jgi:glucose uptake protein
MYQPEAYAAALTFMIISMICWGSWANTMKLTPGYPFQLFYWDYIIGIVVGSLLWGLTLGSLGGGDFAFLDNIRQSHSTHIWFAIAAGAVFNVANLLLVAAIDIAGMAVAFPIGIGLALVVGVLLNYAIAPKGNPALLFSGRGFGRARNYSGRPGLSAARNRTSRTKRAWNMDQHRMRPPHGHFLSRYSLC